MESMRLHRIEKYTLSTIATVAALAFLPLACSAETEPVGVPDPLPPATSIAPPPTSTLPLPTTTNSPPTELPGVIVTRVIDGDTFEIEGGRKVRVLGIDSCEMNTPGGERAKADAARLLSREPVSLRKEPGVDTDRYGRWLRYVGVGPSSIDFGKYMVVLSHTTVYSGKNDASPEYIEELRSADLGPNYCEEAQTRYYPGEIGDEYDGDDYGFIEKRWCRKTWFC